MRKILLICGIASSVLYVATDILVSWWDPNYSYRDQSFYEKADIVKSRRSG